MKRKPRLLNNPAKPEEQERQLLIEELERRVAARNRERATEDTESPPLSWRDLQARPAISREERRELTGQLSSFVRLSIVTAIIFLIGLGVTITILLSRDFLRNAVPVNPRHLLAEVTVRTNGVLDEQWVRSRAGLEDEINLLKLDIHAIKDALESCPQVALASVSIDLPSAIVVQLEERLPVLRARTMDADSNIRELLISEDGAVFEPVNYGEGVIRKLPAIAGIAIVQKAGLYEPLKRFDYVAALLRYAQEHTPHLYYDWRIVDLGGFVTDGPAVGSVIEIRGRYLKRLIFRPEKVPQQLEHLRAVVEDARERGLPALAFVDLTIPDRVVARVGG